MKANALAGSASCTTVERCVPSPSVYLAVSLIAAAALGYEVLLTRLLAIIQWHNYAYMVISLALLGFGASGAYLAAARAWHVPHFNRFFAIQAVGFALSAIGAFQFIQALPFNPLEMIWSPGQIGWLWLMYLALMVPFFFAANAVAIAFLRFPTRIPNLYGADLIGAAAGSAGAVIALESLRPEVTLQGWSALALCAALLVGKPRGLIGLAVRFGLSFACLAVAVSGRWIELEPSAYKGLSRALTVVGARVLEERSTPLGLITAVDSPIVPFRYAPGLSLNATGDVLAQLGLFTDADATNVLTRFDGNLTRLRYLDDVPSALPYHLLTEPVVLVLGAGGGAEVLQALYHRASRIDAVEPDAAIVDLVRVRFAHYTGAVYDQPEVRIHVADLRGFLARDPQRYDLIQIPPSTSQAAAVSGLSGLEAEFDYTVEAMEEYLHHLRPGGMVALSLWTSLPPRAEIRLFATALAALRRSGTSEPAHHLAWVRTWNLSTLVVKSTPWTPGDRAALQEFCQRRAFDLAYYPGMPAGEANLFNRLREPHFFAAASALVGPMGESFLQRYKFDVSPVGDDRPYFHNTFRWSSALELWRERKRGGAPLLEVGYLIALATLVQALLASVLLIAVPVIAISRRSPSSEMQAARGSRILGYFFAIGLAYFFIEIAFIQGFTLFLGHPVYAVAVVLFTFLFFSGLGSICFGNTRNGCVAAPVSFIIGIGALYALGFGEIQARAMALPDIARWTLAVMLVGPIAVPMGTLFPRGLAQLSHADPRLVAWGWAINGCASVVGAVLAIVLASHFGFAMVVGMALGLYVTAYLVRPATFAAPP